MTTIEQRDFKTAQTMIDSYLSNDEVREGIFTIGRDSVDVGGELDFFVDEMEGSYPSDGEFWTRVATWFESRIARVIVLAEQQEDGSGLTDDELVAHLRDTMTEDDVPEGDREWAYRRVLGF